MQDASIYVHVHFPCHAAAWAEMIATPNDVSSLIGASDMIHVHNMETEV